MPMLLYVPTYQLTYIELNFDCNDKNALQESNFKITFLKSIFDQALISII